MHASTALDSIHRTEGTIRPTRAIAWSSVLCGGLLIAALDFAYCLAFWAPHGATATRVLQGVAAGLLGDASYRGGFETVLLGAGLQWLIGASFVLVYAIAARQAPALSQHPYRNGIAYGMALNLVMTRLVVPLSAFPASDVASLAWTLSNVPMFALFGVIAVVFARRA